MIPKYPKTFHLPFSKQIHSDDKTHQDPAFFTNRRVIVTEKIDGGNTGIHHGKLYARSTGQEATAPWFGLTRKHHVWKTQSHPDLIFYGEDYAAVHSVVYEAQAEDDLVIPPFLGGFRSRQLCSPLD
ncbi:hypothetical protein RYZ26_09300 [Terasakiella sp. A23]|uniref:RNA ligase family protein n=1 Tax=Terasakiella sp. FCG-A23 TaxID=3080561 RepID=UPI002955DCA1|nr:RNA ligase family protein [Terasakiella sp. A23]MDV7339787.1 hypothetical protein [Terasakiella sp. A23]